MALLLSPPTLLKNYSNPVGSLYLLGDLGNSRKVAIVGTRKPTNEGIAITNEISSCLAENDILIISGLANGIDSTAHKACIAAGGKTLAVLPCSIDMVYPTSNHWLATKILKTGGGLLSEYPKNHIPQKFDFLARNRIIAGLSDLVIVVEAGLRSGSLNTARHALEMGIDVWAVPGSILSPMSAGTNKLIQQGAYPITSTKDVLDFFDIDSFKDVSTFAQNPIQKNIIKLLKSSPAPIEKVLDVFNDRALEVQGEIVNLELSGVVQRLPGNILKLRGKN